MWKFYWCNSSGSELSESKQDFIRKLAVAQKEADETEYWIELLNQTGYIIKNQYESLFQNITEIRKQLNSTIKTMKSRKSN